MITVNLIADYATVFMRQSPRGDGVWEDVRFVVNSLETTDYCVVFNGINHPLKLHCRQDNIWLLMQESPTPFWKHLHVGNDDYGRILTNDTDLVGSRFFYTQPANNWHVGFSYGELKSMQPCIKHKEISAVISNQQVLECQRIRLRFLENFKKYMDLDHFGRGFNPVDKKWDALAPYKYSMAIENYRNAYYWTEKIADCFLAWSMPIYCGCSRITEYFPSEAMIIFDMEDPNAIEKIQSSIAEKAWEKNREAIEYARNLVLDHYQLLPFLANNIRSHISSFGGGRNDFPEQWVHPVIIKKDMLDRYVKYVRRVVGLVKRLTVGGVY